MNYNHVPPDLESKVAERDGMQLFAEPADIELYMNLRLSAPGIIGKRTWFRLGWVIQEKRITRGRDAALLPEFVLDWVSQTMAAEYPSLQESFGFTDAEIAALMAEQTAKREAYIKQKLLTKRQAPLIKEQENA